MILSLNDVFDDGAVELSEDRDYDGVEEDSEDDPPALLLDLVLLKLDDTNKLDTRNSNDAGQG